jgi:MHS family shikimate/dehydroshikimate transporter-like MFS transporter
MGLLDGRPWLVAGMMVFAGLVSLIAFLASVETKDMDVAAFDPQQERIVTAPKLADEELASAR